MTPAAEERARLQAALSDAEVAVSRAAELFAHSASQLVDQVASIETLREHIGPDLFVYREAVGERARLRKELLRVRSTPSPLEIEEEERQAAHERLERQGERDADEAARRRLELSGRMWSDEEWGDMLTSGKEANDEPTEEDERF